MIRRKVSIVLVLLISNIAFAQESCTEKLVEANDVFSAGQIELVPELLNSCLESGFTKSEKVSAYRLLTLCHLYYNRTDEARETMQLMLKIDPEYKIKDTDPYEFEDLFKSFRSNPVAIVGVKGGFGGTHIYNVKNYNDMNSTDFTGIYTPGFVYMGGVSAEFMLHDYFSVCSELFYSTTSFVLERKLLGYATINAKENITQLEFPILLQYNVLKGKKVTPYLNVGSTLGLLISASSTISGTEQYGNEPKRDLNAKSIDVLDKRNSINYALTAGCGVRVKDIIGNGYITFDIRVSRYMRYNLDDDNRISSPEITYGYMHTDNPLKLENIHFLVGYKLPIYNPKQKRAERMKVY